MSQNSPFHSARTATLRAVILALATAAFLAMSGGQALANDRDVDVKCGDTITADVELEGDLVNCPDDGIVIGADDITLDLDGHVIDGDNVRPPCDPSQCETDFGVDNTAGHTGVKIEHGSVQEFEVGVSLEGASDNRLHHLSLSSNLDFGLFLISSTESRIEKNSLSGNGTSGVVLVDSASNRVERNSASANGHASLFLFASDQNRIEHNVLDGNGDGVEVHESSDNDIRRNSISHSNGAAIDLSDGTVANRVERNLIIGNGDGIGLFEAVGNEISHNTITRTGFFGDPDAGGFGIIFDGADDNLIERNSVEDGRGEAIFVTSLDSRGTSDGNVISRNEVNSKFVDGILVDGGATDTLINHNSADDNGDDGIDVNAPATTLTGNSADDNGDLGIEAVSGVIDGGGNRARGNANSLQCLNVVCNKRRWRDRRGWDRDRDHSRLKQAW
jgi:parallel beta-helix repeat protein